MSAPSSSRSSVRSASQRPSTPDHTKPSMPRTTSSAVAPKSEYLRNALQQRRALNAPAPLPLDLRSVSGSSHKSAEVQIARSATPDEDADFTLTEEQMAPVSPVRRRRPSEVGLPRPKTTRELESDMSKLKEGLMTANMRVELLKKKNKELDHDYAEAMKRVEELEPLEDENYDLREENENLRLKMQTMEDEIDRLKCDYDEAHKTNEEWIAINEECTSHLEEQESAVQEAVDTIIALETEKSKLADEIRSLLDRVAAIEDSSQAGTLVDGSTRCPSRVYSIDESRPSTSHFDSDYYSQPASPQVKPSAASIISITPSERSKKFLNQTEDRRRSARDLMKRMSAASLKALNIRSPSPAPDVPPVPAAYQQAVPQIVQQVIEDDAPAKTPKRYRERRLPQQPLLDALDALQVSPTKSESVTPTTPVRPSGGLRRYYQSDKSDSSRPSSSHKSDQTASSRRRSRKPSGTDMEPRASSRRSSRIAYTSSNEQMAQPTPRESRHRRQSEPSVEAQDAQTKADFEAWASSSMPPPPLPPARAHAPSVTSTTSLTTDVDADTDKTRWWRSVDRLNQNPHHTPALSHHQRGNSINDPIPLPPPTSGSLLLSSRPPVSPTLTRSQSHVGAQAMSTRSDLLAKVMKTPSKERDANGVRRSRTQPNTPATTPYAERDFFFNGAEDEDTFMRKAKAFVGRR